jgi:hypothetical protein
MEFVYVHTMLPYKRTFVSKKRLFFYNITVNIVLAGYIILNIVIAKL